MVSRGLWCPTVSIRRHLPQHACRSSFGRSCPGSSQPIRAVASAASLAFARISVPSSVRRPPGAVRGAARCHCGGVVRTDLFVGYAGPDRPWGGVGSSAVRGGPVIGRLDLYDWDRRFQRGPEHERRTNWAGQTVGLRWARFGGWKVCRIDIERMRSHVPAVPLAARTLGLVDSDSITRSSDAVPGLATDPQPLARLDRPHASRQQQPELRLDIQPALAPAPAHQHIPLNDQGSCCDEHSNPRSTAGSALAER